MQIDGGPVAEDALAAALERVRLAAPAVEREAGEGPTQFEALTGAAFLLLAEAGVEVVVVEAGLGGRYDATNVLDATLVGLTSVGLDHADVLGERARPSSPRSSACWGTARCWSAARSTTSCSSARRCWRARAARAARGASAPRRSRPSARRCRGRFLRANAALALRAGRGVARAAAARPRPRARAALRAAVPPGRLELEAGSPPILLDGAHNADGMRALAAELDGALGARRPRVAVVALQADKAAAEMAARAAAARRRASSRRPAGRPGCLSAARGRVARAAEPRSCDDPAAALERAVALAGPGGAVLVTGSLYLLGALSAARPGPGRGKVSRRSLRRSVLIALLALIVTIVGLVRRRLRGRQAVDLTSRNPTPTANDRASEPSLRSHRRRQPALGRPGLLRLEHLDGDRAAGAVPRRRALAGARVLDVQGRAAPHRRPVLVAVAVGDGARLPVRRRARLHDPAPAGVPRRRARARARDPRHGATARATTSAVRTAAATSSRASSSARTARTGSRPPAGAAAARSSPAGGSARTARQRCSARRQRSRSTSIDASHRRTAWRPPRRTDRLESPGHGYRDHARPDQAGRRPARPRRRDPRPLRAPRLPHARHAPARARARATPSATTASTPAAVLRRARRLHHRRAARGARARGPRARSRPCAR